MPSDVRAFSSRNIVVAHSLVMRMASASVVAVVDDGNVVGLDASDWASVSADLGVAVLPTPADECVLLLGETSGEEAFDEDVEPGNDEADVLHGTFADASDG